LAQEVEKEMRVRPMRGGSQPEGAFVSTREALHGFYGPWYVLGYINTRSNQEDRAEKKAISPNRLQFYLLVISVAEQKPEIRQAGNCASTLVSACRTHLHKLTQ